MIQRARQSTRSGAPEDHEGLKMHLKKSRLNAPNLEKERDVQAQEARRVPNKKARQAGPETRCSENERRLKGGLGNERPAEPMTREAHGLRLTALLQKHRRPGGVARRVQNSGRGKTAPLNLQARLSFRRKELS